ncbi:polyprenyl synthetase family protein [bacterium]|nr:polyprenyl synthetase family protein [bacterium]
MSAAHSVQDQLQHVGERMEAIVAGSEGIVTRYIAEVGQSRGKLLRPRLLINMASLGDSGRYESFVNCAACCELLHTATLIHDDVIDEAETRRGKLTLSSRFGNEIAVVVGDYLLALVFEAVTSERDFRLLELMFAASRELGLGVIEEVVNRNNLDLSVEKYYDVIYLKTGSLFALVSQMGAYLGGAGEPLHGLARDYGKQLGLAFQVVDDLLDLTLDPAATGKPAMNDIKEGRITLPVIHAHLEAPELTAKLVDAYQSACAEQPGSAAEQGAAAELRSHLSALGSLGFAYGEAQRLLSGAAQTRSQMQAAGAGAAALEVLAGIEHSVLDVLSPSLALGPA